MSDLGFYLVQALTGLSSASALFLVASGLSIIFGVTRVVNFAHGSFYMLGAYIAYTLVELLGGAVGFWAAVLLAGLAVGVIGVIVELLVLRRVYQAPGTLPARRDLRRDPRHPGPRPPGVGGGRPVRPVGAGASRAR